MAEKENKRYFWLQLHEDFFTSKRIKKLRRLGADFVIIYLKMQLLSLQNNGVIEFSGLEKTLAEELALEIDEDVDKIQVTLAYLQSCNLLVPQDENDFFLPYVEICTGSETASTRRSQKCRAKKVLQCNDDATLVQLPCNGEKEKEIDIEIEKDTKRSKAPAVYFDDSALNDAFLDYIKMRKQIKAPMTDRAIELAITKLQNLSHGDNNKAIAILEQSIMNSWKGLFELDKPKKQERDVVSDWFDA